MDLLGVAEGLDKQELSRLERGALPMTNVRREALCRVLRVPRRWFQSDDLDEVVGLTAQENEDALAVLRELLTRLQPPEGPPSGEPGHPR